MLLKELSIKELYLEQCKDVKQIILGFLYVDMYNITSCIDDGYYWLEFENGISIIKYLLQNNDKNLYTMMKVFCKLFKPYACKVKSNKIVIEDFIRDLTRNKKMVFKEEIYKLACCNESVKFYTTCIATSIIYSHDRIGCDNTYEKFNTSNYMYRNILILKYRSWNMFMFDCQEMIDNENTGILKKAGHTIEYTIALQKNILTKYIKNHPNYYDN